MNELTRMLRESTYISDDKTSTYNHYLYFVYANEAVKIGITNCIEKRMYHYKTSNPGDVILIADLTLQNKEIAEILESKIHNKFKQYKIKGEWFCANEEILNFAKLVREAENKRRKKMAEKSRKNMDKIIKQLKCTEAK